MKAYHQIEFEDFIQWLAGKITQAQLQDILAYDKHLVLGFYQKGQGTQWLVIDLNNNAPMALLFDSNPITVKKLTKPMSLFLNANAKNLYVEKVEALLEWGRVFVVHLTGSESACRIEVQLIPKAPNIIAQATRRVAKKEQLLSWFKQRKLVRVGVPEVDEVRSIAHIHSLWLEGQRRPGVGNAKGSNSFLEKARKKLETAIVKKRKALQEIEKALNSQESNEWYRLGELLKVQSLKDIDRQWDPFLDRRRSQAWNMEQVFQKAKSLEKKKFGSLQRKKILEEEIKKLEEDLASGVENLLKTPQASGIKARKSPQDVKSRKKIFSSGLIGYLGKSAADNLKILRQSQAWDIWLHLRDYPSAHAILQRNKNQEVGFKDLQQVALWLAQESLQKKLLLPGTKLEIVYTECRFVRPLKGDKIGRVHYHNEKHFNLIITP